MTTLIMVMLLNLPALIYLFSTSRMESQSEFLGNERQLDDLLLIGIEE